MARLVPVRFGDYLVERQAISEAQLLDALAEHWSTGCKLGESVARKGYLPPDEVERLASDFRNVNTIYV